MKKFFMRNDPQTIQDALDLSLEDFVKKYKPTTTTEEIISKVYYEINNKHKASLPPVPIPVQDRKTVTFKVIKREKMEQKKQEEVLTPEEQEELLALEANLEESELAGSGEAIQANNDLPPVKKKQTRIRSSDKGAARTARITVLLKEGKKAKEIIEIMKTEGFKVHIPQVSLVKTSLGL